MLKKRGQVAVEYMAVVGIATVIALSMLIVSGFYSRQTEEIINTNQIDQIAKKIVDTSEEVYYFGEPSKITLKVYIPKGINRIDIHESELVFNVNLQSGDSDISYVSAVPLQGEISVVQGYRYIEIEASGGYVWINGT